jgi:hypothetical protein
MNMNPFPHELALGEILMPPLLVAAALAVIASLVTARLLNKYRLSRHFSNPPLVFVALTVIYTVLIGTLFIRI